MPTTSDLSCPWCLNDHGIKSATAGETYITMCCGKRVRAVDWEDGELSGVEMIKVGTEPNEPLPSLSPSKDTNRCTACNGSRFRSPGVPCRYCAGFGTID